MVERYISFKKVVYYLFNHNDLQFFTYYHYLVSHRGFFQETFLGFYFIRLCDHCIEMIGGQIEDADVEQKLKAEEHIGIDGEGAPTAQGGVFNFDISE